MRQSQIACRGPDPPARAPREPERPANILNAPNTVYGRHFYAEQLEGSRASARVLVEMLSAHWQPASVLDIGCGRGAWLAAWGERGVSRLVGLDGPWNDATQMIWPAIEFRAVDLERAPAVGERFDLAMSIEVVEHLAAAAGEAVVDALVAASDVVVFSAAFSGQGGVHHVHERYHSHWGGLFRARSFRTFDLFRPRLWGDARVMPWHRANVFLHVRDGHALATTLREAGVPELAELAFMDCVHPWLYERLRVDRAGFGTHLRALWPSLLRSLRRRGTP